MSSRFAVLFNEMTDKFMTSESVKTEKLSEDERAADAVMKLHCF